MAMSPPAETRTSIAVLMKCQLVMVYNKLIICNHCNETHRVNWVMELQVDEAGNYVRLIWCRYKVANKNINKLSAGFMKGLHIILLLAEVKMLACRQVPHSSIHLVQKAKTGIYIYSLSRENATPSQNKSGKFSRSTHFHLCPPTICRRQCRQKLSPVQDVPQRPRVNEWRGKNYAVFNTVSSLGRQNCCELSSMTRMCRKFLTWEMKQKVRQEIRACQSSPGEAKSRVQMESWEVMNILWASTLFYNTNSQQNSFLSPQLSSFLLCCNSEKS